MLNRISGALPVRPFNLALMGPFAQHGGFDWKDLGVLLAWGAAGALIAVRASAGTPDPNNRDPRTGGTQWARTSPRAHQLTVRTIAPPAPWPFTPSKDGACSATG